MIKRLAILGGAVALGKWLLKTVPPNPRDWPDAAKGEAQRIKEQAAEAVAAGKRAAERRQDEVQREIDAASQPRKYS